MEVTEVAQPITEVIIPIIVITGIRVMDPEEEAINSLKLRGHLFSSRIKVSCSNQYVSSNSSNSSSSSQGKTLGRKVAAITKPHIVVGLASSRQLIIIILIIIIIQGMLGGEIKEEDPHIEVEAEIEILVATRTKELIL